jgi:hypothetical protein
MEIEKKRSGKRFAKADLPMKFSEASRLLNSAILVMKILGWAWRWSEWWVDYNSTWEPLLEPGEREEDMTAAQLRIIESTRESRCDDARKCRLAALGAALRSRKYDTEDGFDRNALDRALRAVLNTKSLVGPLNDFEIDFFVDWLGRAYRSKSRLLGFDEDSISGCSKRFCLHIQDQSPKFELGPRSVPGMQERKAGQVFEIDTNDIDDFLQTEVLEDDMRMSPRRQTTSPKVNTPSRKSAPPSRAKSGGRDRKRSRGDSDSDIKSNTSAAVAAVVPSAVKKRIGRPPKDRGAVVQSSSPPAASSGRKRLSRPPIPSEASSSFVEASHQGAGEAIVGTEPFKKRLGRPPKVRRPAAESVSVPAASLEQEGVDPAAEPELSRTRRGRRPRDEPGTAKDLPSTTGPTWEQERVDPAAEPELTRTRRGRRPRDEPVTESELPSTTGPTSEPPRKRLGRPPKVRHSAVNPLPSTGPTDQGVSELVQEGDRSESPRGRSQRSRRPVEAYDPAAFPTKHKESQLPRKRRGRPPRAREPLESTLPEASTTEQDAASVEKAEPRVDQSVEASLPETATEAVLKEALLEENDDGKSSETVSTSVPAALHVPGYQTHALDSAVETQAEQAGLSPKESAAEANPADSKFGLVKRQRRPTMRYQDLGREQVKSKSYGDGSNDETDTDTDDATPERPKQRKRAMSEDDLTIADFVARHKGGMSRDTKEQDRKPAAAAAASSGEQDQKPAASTLADTSSSSSRLEQQDEASLADRNDEVLPPALASSEERPSDSSEQQEAAEDSTALAADGEADTASKRGRRQGKMEAARTILDPY